MRSITSTTRVALVAGVSMIGLLASTAAWAQVEGDTGTAAAAATENTGIADIVVDLTSTGSTLKMNGLREIETVMKSSAHLVTAVNGPRNGDPSRVQELNDLVTALGSVIRARGQRYLMANVPRASLDQVRTVLPGLNGPTVIEIAATSREGWWVQSSRPAASRIFRVWGE